MPLDFNARLVRSIPAMRWLRQYHRGQARADLLAALIVLAMLVPQGMAYAMLAGLPPVMGLYASILPMICYALLGNSPTLSIGPVAIISMMTFATLSPLFEVGSPVYIEAACLLALMVGVISLLLGLLRFGFLIQLISHPVIQSFIIASALLIALGQVKFLLNLPLKANNLIDFIYSLWQYFQLSHLPSLALGLLALVFLRYIPQLLQRYTPSLMFLQRTVPLILVLSAIALVASFNLTQYGIQTVGTIPSGFPMLSLPHLNQVLMIQLLPGAFMIAMISFIESLAIAQATALQKRQALDSNQELIALGVANLSAGLSHALPVTGSLSRTVVNADAGAKTPMAGVYASCFILLVSLYLTDIFQYLPLSVLAATIILSIWKLVSLTPFLYTWRYSKIDGIAMWVTLIGVLCIDISTGLMIGIISTFILQLWRMSRPHIAIIGLVDGTQHFRNVQRHAVRTSTHLLSMRIDENLNFLNAQQLKNTLIEQISKNPQLQHVVLNCSSISAIDLSALEMLQELNQALFASEIRLHFSEVKGPVMDQLTLSHLLPELHGKVYLSHYQAIAELAPEQII